MCLLTLNDTQKLGTTPLDRGSARLRENIRKRQTAMSPVGFEFSNSSKRAAVHLRLRPSAIAIGN